MQKRIGVINDISCEGRCSATAALPIYAAAGIHGNVIPTALLSTQTGGYSGYTYLDLSGEMIGIVRHFKELGLMFDVLYTGYLASEDQIELVMQATDILNAKTLVVDPVMGDGGKLYDGFTASYCDAMKKLCAKADVIVPNLTEACFLTGHNYGDVDLDNINDIVMGLKGLGARRIVVTGLKRRFDKADRNNIGIAVADNEKLYTEFFFEIEGIFHGAGDVFGAALACGIAYDKDLTVAAKVAHEFTYEAIKRTAMDGSDTRQGLNFEPCLGKIFTQYNN